MHPLTTPRGLLVRDASDRYRRVVTSGTRNMVTRLEVLFDGDTVIAAENGPLVVGGRITWNRNANLLARLDCTLADPLRVPKLATDPLAPFGAEVRVWRGVRFSDGTEELVPLGTFRLDTATAESPGLTTTVSGWDRMLLVERARFEDAYAIAPATNYASAIETLIVDGVPGIECLFPSSTFTAPRLVFAAQDNRREAVSEMARMIGNELRFDGLGRCIMSPEPSFSDAPVADIAEGVNLVTGQIGWTGEGVVNKIIAYSSNPELDEVFEGSATDDDLSSPTRYDGPFGRVPQWYASPFIASTAQATSAARAVLQSKLGVSKGFGFAAVPHDLLEVSDVVWCRNTDLGVDELHIVETLTLDLTVDGVMTGTARAQQGATT